MPDGFTDWSRLSQKPWWSYSRSWESCGRSPSVTSHPLSALPRAEPSSHLATKPSSYWGRLCFVGLTKKSRSPKTGYSRLIRKNHPMPLGLPLTLIKKAGLSPSMIQPRKVTKNISYIQIFILSEVLIHFMILCCLALWDRVFMRTFDHCKSGRGIGRYEKRSFFLLSLRRVAPFSENIFAESGKLRSFATV